MTLDEAYEEALVASDWLTEKGYHPWVGISEWTGGWRVSVLVRTGEENWLTVGDIVKRNGSRPWHIRYGSLGGPGLTTSEEVSDALAGAQQLHTLVGKGVMDGLPGATQAKLKARLLR